ncbi:polyprenyl synthetase family protein [Stigmatella aurantiaca]|uniref:Geranylgeranyl diphosphate synthase n=1 Tax=Stigmatella aurantiaca (strain DW4/3-1) TaxID=378806 RepID=Q08PP2_STIAD|nr:polyprenyl synthetase family protein [Stigmatella aurantiaca]ADO71933.1 Geranylgeranyl diphosphate synthase [Stigmatella aurantiaca DW4/3-1]EAU62446.1 geranylgeranyl pyrophosphate synthetase, (ggppsynthetase) (ggps) [Stigmatella aurantiaca DW4/3-1]
MSAANLSARAHEATSSIDFRRRLHERQQLVARALDEHFPPGAGHLTAAIREALLADGKRLRPILCLEACEWVGGSVKAALPAACALEMIHKMTLVHDDLPAMDDAETRNGRPALHKVHGEALAILAGDALLVHAFGLLASTRGVPAERVTVAIRRLCQALGTTGLAGGQALDVLSQTEGVTPEKLDHVHTWKTASFFEVAIVIGAEMGGADASQVEALARYGMLLGRAFQISDDLLDARDEKGKVEGEVTNYVQLHGVEGARRKLRELLNQAVSSIASVKGGDIQLLAGITELVWERSWNAEEEEGHHGNDA